MTIIHLPRFVRANYEIHEWKHASAVLETDYPEEWGEVIEVL